MFLKNSSLKTFPCSNRYIRTPVVELAVEKLNAEVVQIELKSAPMLLDGTGAPLTKTYQLVHPALTRVLMAYAVGMN